MSYNPEVMKRIVELGAIIAFEDDGRSSFTLIPPPDPVKACLVGRLATLLSEDGLDIFEADQDGETIDGRLN